MYLLKTSHLLKKSNKENLSKQINDTMNIFQNIREHLTNPKGSSNSKRINTSTLIKTNNSGLNQPNTLKKKNLAISINNYQISDSMKKEKKNFQNFKESLVFKTIPNENKCNYLSEKKIPRTTKSNELNKFVFEKKESKYIKNHENLKKRKIIRQRK